MTDVTPLFYSSIRVPFCLRKSSLSLFYGPRCAFATLRVLPLRLARSTFLSCRQTPPGSPDHSQSIEIQRPARHLYQQGSSDRDASSRCVFRSPRHSCLNDCEYPRRIYLFFRIWPRRNINNYREPESDRDLENTAYFLRLRAMATIPSPTRPVARRTSEAGSGTTGAALWAFAVAGNSIPINIQYTDFIRASYFLRRRVMATIPSPTKPVAKSTSEAGSGTTGTPLAFAVAGKSMAAIIQYTYFINPPCRAEKRHYTWRHDSYHERKLLKTNLLFYCDKERGCGTVKISYTQVMPSFVKKAYLLRV